MRQIGIRMNVGGGGAGEAAEPPEPGEAPRLTASERAALVDECVAAVVETLRMAGER